MRIELNLQIIDYPYNEVQLKAIEEKLKEYGTKRIPDLENFRLELMEMNDCLESMPLTGLIRKLTDLRKKNNLKVEYRFNDAQLNYLKNHVNNKKGKTSTEEIDNMSHLANLEHTTNKNTSLTRKMLIKKCNRLKTTKKRYN